MRRHAASPLLFLICLGLYVTTLAPTVVTLFDDSLEFQVVLPTFAIAHPTGYPLYTLLGWLATRVVPLGDAAFRTNLFSALAASAAVVVLYAAARRLGSSAAPGFVAALLFAISPIWWSQATIAEVYTLQGLITLAVIYALLRWDETRDGAARQRWLALAALAIGLGLAHHRLTLLLLPGVLVFVLWTEPGLLRRPAAWGLPLVALLAPLLLNALLPLRSGVGSLDGSYARLGFWRWIAGGGYSTFLENNPLGVQRTFMDLLELLLSQFGLLGVIVAAAGAGLWRMQPRRLALLALIGAADLVFAWRYLVADVEVFLIPAVIVWAFLIAVGLTAVWDSALVYAAGMVRRLWQRPPRFLPAAVRVAAAVCLLLWPATLLAQRLPEQNRQGSPARAWGVHDYGLDMLDAVAPGGSVVGILGEMTLLRYFQRTQGLRQDVQTTAADAEPDRLAALAASVASGRPTYTTRPLAGLAGAFSLDAAGPLVRVWPSGAAKPETPAHKVAVSMTPQVTLAGWDMNLRQPRSGPSARLTLQWQTAAPPPTDFKVSARLYGQGDTLLVQRDDIPVHNTYPPSSWRQNETIDDVYDLPLPSVPADPVKLVVILYDPLNGAEMARWEQPDITW